MRRLSAHHRGARLLAGRASLEQAAASSTSGATDDLLLFIREKINYLLSDI
jgi:hypothetical protein